MKKILFVTYGGGHVNIIDLIAKQLLKEKDIEFKILALTTAYNKIAKKYPDNIVKRISDYRHIFINDINKIEEYGLELLTDNYNPDSGISREDTIFYLGVSMFELVEKYGLEKAKLLYSKRKRQVFLPVNAMKKILDYENIKLVFTTTSPRFEEASIIAAKELKIESMQILDMFANIYPVPKANHIICMNDSIKRDLIKIGLNNSKIYPFGQPVIEKSVQKILTIDKNDLSKKIDITDNKTLLFATQRLVKVNKEFKIMHDIEYEKVYDRLFEKFSLLHKQYKINILVRIHPNENYDSYKKYFKKYNFMKFVNDKLTFEESIAISDMVLIKTSTVGIEALASNKIVFTYMHEYDDYYTVPKYKTKPFIFSKGIDNLYKNISQYLDNPKKIKSVKNFLPKNSAKNIAKLIKEL